MHLQEAETGNGEHTVAFVQALQAKHPNKQIWILWDGAKHQRYGKIHAYLVAQNEGLAEQQWRITCLWFAPNAPEQNPVEDIWLKGKNTLRKAFNDNPTFAKVKQCFMHSLKNVKLSAEKLTWYWSRPHFI